MLKAELSKLINENYLVCNLQAACYLLKWNHLIIIDPACVEANFRGREKSLLSVL